MLIFTSCTNNYIPKARILASTLKSFHPDWIFCLLLGEPAPSDFSIENEPFDRILGFDQINIPNYHAWLFRHRVVEICTAAKGPALAYFVNIEKHDKVMYLDPDIMVLNSLSYLEEKLDTYDILLTPHQLAPQKELHAVIDNEICALKHGVYNLGFVAVAQRGQGPLFARWWNERLYHFCYDDIPNGLFTDQRWCDLAPAFFSNLHIIRDPGCNAATWNLTDRTITKGSDGIFYANDVPLRFYHFTGYDSGAGRKMASIYGRHMPAVTELWDIYAEKLEHFEHDRYKKMEWKYSFFDNKKEITDEMRMVYRNTPSLHDIFSNPFCSIDDGDFLFWYNNQYSDMQIAHKGFKKIYYILYILSSLTRTYIRKHGGLKAIPRIVKQSCQILSRSGVDGFIARVRKFKKDSERMSEDTLLSFEDIKNRTNVLAKTIAHTLHTCFARGKNGICILDHGYGGGANLYTEKKIQYLLRSGRPVLLLTWDIFSCRIIAKAYCNSLKYAFFMYDLDELINSNIFYFDDISINNLVTWYTQAERTMHKKQIDLHNLLKKITELKDIHTANLEIPVHDFYSICPSYTLVNHKNIFCNIPKNVDDCEICLKNNSLFKNYTFSIKAWREAWQKIFEETNEIIFFSYSSLSIVKKVYQLKEEQICVKPHDPIAPFQKNYSIPNEGSMKIAVIGTITVYKGANIVIELSRILKPSEEIIIIGELYSDTKPGNNIRIHGRYEREELPELLEKYKITVAFMPSICPETFSYVTQECMMLNIPTVAFNLGAQGERIGKWEYGLLAKEMTAESAYVALKKLDARRSLRMF